MLRTLGRIDATEQFKHIVVATVEGHADQVSDVGTPRTQPRKRARPR